jgi:REP element-mobilizing transposase RayT
MINKWWLELENKFKQIKLDEHIIMPNHMHGIIIINESSVGDDLRVVPQDNDKKREMRDNLSLPEIIQWFKTMTTNDYIKGVKQNIYAPFKNHLWQRSYYDRIIRNEKELNNTREYIYYNPLKWDWEKNHPENL